MSVQTILLPYQSNWIKDTASVQVCEKSRRVGLSWCEASDDVLYSAAKAGDDCWYIGYNQDMAREFIEDCAFWARQFQSAAEAMEEDVLEGEGLEGRDILVYRIKFASGHKITALSSRPSNLRGKQGRVVIDEAAFHPDLPGLLKAAMALLMWGGQVRVISTHNGDDNPFNELVQDIRAGKKPYALHRITIDDALEAGLYQRICLRLGREWSPEAEAEWRAELMDFYGDDADEELLCIPKAGGGAYLSRQLIESRMDAGCTVVRLAKDDAFTHWPPHMREAETRDWCEAELLPHLKALNPVFDHCFGEDFGRVADLTVLAVFEVNQALERHVPLLVELRNVPYEQQRQILFYLCDRLPRFRAGALDAKGNGGYLAEVAGQRYGERIQAVQLSEGWYRENMPAFKAAFQDATISIPKDAEVLDDLRAFQMVKGVGRIPENARTQGATGKRHGDAGIALALGHWATRQEVIEYAYHPVKPVSEEGNPMPREVKLTAGWGRREGAW